MKKFFALILALLCLLTMLSIPALAADAGIEPYGTPGSGYDQKTFTFNGRQYTATMYLQFNSSIIRMWPRANARRSQRHKLTIEH